MNHHHNHLCIFYMQNHKDKLFSRDSYILFNLFFGSTVVWNQGFVLPRQALYQLSHNSSCFTLVSLETGSYFHSVLLFDQTKLKNNFPVLCFLSSLEWQVCANMPSFFLLKWSCIDTSLVQRWASLPQLLKV
jgi:hypothetical protein